MCEGARNRSRLSELDLGPEQRSVVDDDEPHGGGKLRFRRMQRSDAQAPDRLAFEERLAAERLEEHEEARAEFSVEPKRRDENLRTELLAAHALGDDANDAGLAGRGDLENLAGTGSESPVIPNLENRPCTPV